MGFSEMWPIGMSHNPFETNEKWGVHMLHLVQHEHTQVYRAKSRGKSELGMKLSQEDSSNSMKYGIISQAEWKWKAYMKSTVSILKNVITQPLLDVLYGISDNIQQCNILWMCVVILYDIFSSPETVSTDGVSLVSFVTIHGAVCWMACIWTCKDREFI